MKNQNYTLKFTPLICKFKRKFGTNRKNDWNFTVYLFERTLFKQLRTMKNGNKLHRHEASDDQSRRENDEYRLVLYNDDVNEFNYVIEALIEVCSHDNLQAEQCTYLAHYQGQCEIKTGPYENLKSMKDTLVERGLRADIQ